MVYDVIIIGCGPAGMMAAIYALRAKKSVLIIEKETIGGKIASSPLVENFPGYEKISGMELSDKLYSQMTNLGGEVIFDQVLNIVDGEIKQVIGEDNTYEAKSIIIATGSTYRLLGLDKEKDLIGNGISFCTVCDGSFYQDQEVAVVGGGNSALQNAIELARICKKIYLIVRKDHFRGEESLVEQVKKVPNIEILYNSQIKEFVGDTELESIVIKTNEKEIKLAISGVFLAIGQDPDVDLVKNMASFSSNNYIVTDTDCQIVPGIYAAGDCRDKKVRQLTTAVSDGTIAALSAISYLNNL